VFEMPSRLIAWDFDGTLADTFAAIRWVVAGTLAAHDLPPCTDDVLRATIGLGLADVYRSFTNPTPDDELLTSLVTAHRRTFSTPEATARCVLYPGVADLLAELAGRGVQSAIATSRFRPSVEQLVDHLAVREHIAHVASTTDLPDDRGKPRPDVVLAACAALDRSPADAVVIGDATVDIGMGHAAGAATIAVTWGNGHRDELRDANPTHLVDTVDELRELLSPV
jgi:phosphoglycolate phosphatase